MVKNAKWEGDPSNENRDNSPPYGGNIETFEQNNRQDKEKRSRSSSNASESLHIVSKTAGQSQPCALNLPNNRSNNISFREPSEIQFSSSFTRKSETSTDQLEMTEGPTSDANLVSRSNSNAELKESTNDGGRFNTRRVVGMIDSIISSAAQHVHQIDKSMEIAPAEQNKIVHNVGHIKFKPDESVLPGGRTDEQMYKLGDIEANIAPASKQARPGLLSNYLKLMHLERRNHRNHQPNRRSKGERRSTYRHEIAKASKYAKAYPTIASPTTYAKSPAEEDTQTEWEDLQEGSRIPRTFSQSILNGLRHRRHRKRQGTLDEVKRSQVVEDSNPPSIIRRNKRSGFFSAKHSREGTAQSPARTPLANKPGVPFRHLSEALPWVASARSLSVAGGTPLATTRNHSIESLVDEVTTIPGVYVDNTPGTIIGSAISSTKKGMLGLNSPGMDTSGFNTEKQNIEYAIELLLMHQRFLVLMSKAMMMYGSPLHHLEDNLARLAEMLDLKISVSTIPGIILLSFDDSVTHMSETKIICCSNGWDMHRLDQTNQILRKVVHGDAEVKDAIKELEDVMTAPPIYAWYWQLLNWGLLSGSLSLSAFNASWKDAGISAALGLIAGTMNFAAGKFSGYTNFFEVSLSVVVGIFAAALSKWGCFGVVSLAGTVVLLPGLVMTTGVIELSSRHMVAGTARVFYGLLLAFIIAYGLLIGVEIYNKIAGNDALDNAFVDITVCDSLNPWSIFGTFPVGIISIAILVNIHWRHWISVIAIAGATYAVFWAFKTHLDLPDLAPIVASFVLGITANILSKFTGQTAYMILLPGEMFLVPGSVGVRGISSLLSKKGGQGAELAIQMVTTCLSLMMGLFASTFVIYPKGKQHSALVTV